MLAPQILMVLDHRYAFAALKWIAVVWLNESTYYSYVLVLSLSNKQRCIVSKE